jgi:hypothetical protein|tara:strand:- start:424 stop:768 length:345 start_codon:yes stop_codon:yes gene_type:complete
MEKQLKVDIQDDKGNLVDSYLIDKATVGQTARRFSLISKVVDRKMPSHEQGQMLNCCALASVLKNLDGELLFPDDDGADRLYNEMSYEQCSLLVDSYLEINPITSGLKAKKKKY